jgi:AcrR family transcriptional regulator
VSRETARRDALADAATDYVLAHGLIGLSLRPLAAALGTSDRMLLYHFDGKDDLVATVLRVSNDRAVGEIRRLAASSGPREAVLDVWSAMQAPQSSRCQRTYVEAAALGLFGREPYVSTVRQGNRQWVAAVADHLVRSGTPRTQAARAVELLDAAMMGFLLDLPLEPADPARDRAVRDLADAVAAIAAEEPAQGRA